MSSDQKLQILPQNKILSDETKFEVEPIKHLKQAFEARYRTLVNRSHNLGIIPPDKDQLWKIVLDSWNRGFRCEYCGNKMKIKDDRSQGNKSFSIEHMLSLFNGGDNQKENLLVVCTECNTRKGTLPQDLFQQYSQFYNNPIQGLSPRIISFFHLKEDGWSSTYVSTDNLLRHLSRRSKSISTRKNYLQHLRSFCFWTMKNPDELIKLNKDRIEHLIQSYCDTYNSDQFSRRTANNVLTVLRSFYEANGFYGYNQLHIEGYYTPKRYRKKAQYIPHKHEVYAMADSAGSLKNRAIILFMYHTGIRNSTLLALRYQDIKDELLGGKDIIKIPIYPEMKEMDYNACKNHLPYYTFISDEAIESLRLYLHEKKTKYQALEEDLPLFSSDYNQIEKDLRTKTTLTSRQLQKIVKQSAKNAGIEQWKDVTPHSLRKAYESILRSDTIQGIHLDPKIQEFFMGHTLPGSQDNYFDSSKIEDLRYHYSTLRFGRVKIENRFQKLQRVISKEFQGSGIDTDQLIEEYLTRKEKIKNMIGC